MHARCDAVEHPRLWRGAAQGEKNGRHGLSRAGSARRPPLGMLNRAGRAGAEPSSKHMAWRGSCTPSPSNRTVSLSAGIASVTSTSASLVRSSQRFG